MVISAVAGMAGVGKTALAVHWARKVAGRFPDGQLYVNLRGYDAEGAAVTAEEVTGWFLVALGVPAGQIPADAQARSGLYRSVLAGRRVLVMLQNARGRGAGAGRCCWAGPGALWWLVTSGSGAGRGWGCCVQGRGRCGLGRAGRAEGGRPLAGAAGPGAGGCRTWSFRRAGRLVRGPAQRGGDGGPGLLLIWGCWLGVLG